MLGLQKITEAVEYTSFDCGNVGIQEQIRRSYFASLLREGYAYEIVIQAETDTPKTVGHCMVRLVTLNCEQIPEEDAEYYSEIYAGQEVQRSAAEITYLAIDRAVQGKRLGINALRILVKYILEISLKVPIRYIVLHSLLAKVPFYKKLGFQVLGEPEMGSETQFMYFDCLEDRRELNAYLERI